MEIRAGDRNVQPRQRLFRSHFAERALTIGRKKLNAGVNYQHVSFDRLDGKSLTGGELVGYTGLPYQLGSERRPDGIFFQEALDLHLTTDTVSAFATYGLSDRLDVGVAVPINHVNVKATITSKWGNTITGIGNPTRPGDEARLREPTGSSGSKLSSDLGVATRSSVRPDGCGLKSEASGSATGIGDIVIRN